MGIDLLCLCFNQSKPSRKLSGVCVAVVLQIAISKLVFCQCGMLHAAFSAIQTKNESAIQLNGPCHPILQICWVFTQGKSPK
jgi:hypothetical protein